MDQGSLKLIGNTPLVRLQNIKIRNEMAPGTEGGFTTLQPDGKVMSVYDAAMEYKKRKNDLVVIAGKEYG